MVTIKDVAKKAGVSPSTVSRALHDSSLISTETKQIIKKAMDELNYLPNFAAQNLANSSSNIVGVILPPNKQSISNNPFFSQVLQGITSVCNQQKFMVALAAGNNDDELIQNIETMIDQGKVNRFIITYSQKSDEVIKFLEDKNVEYVLIGDPIKDSSRTLFVNNDNLVAGKDATSFLFNQNYQYPAFVYSDLMEMVQHDRYSGYMQIMKNKGKEAINYQINMKRDPAKFQKFMDSNSRIDSFVVNDDIMAISLQNMLLAINLDPQNYGIISFNNSIFARTAHPTITSVEIFPKSLGMEAAVLILNAHDKDFKKLRETVSNVIIPHKIFERQSTRKN